MVDFEEERLEILRVVAGTEGVPQWMAANNRGALAAWVPQIIANSATDAVELLDAQGLEIYGWQRPPRQIGGVGIERAGADFSQLAEVQRVLAGEADEFGDKRILLTETPHGLMIFTIGPVYQDGKLVGSVMIGSYIKEMLVELAETSLAHVTFYDRSGRVIDTTLGGGQEGVAESISEGPGHYQMVMELLRESPGHYRVVSTNAENEVSLEKVQVIGQQYTLAYGDWRLRNQSFGLFSVALPHNFIVSAAATSRSQLSILFSIAAVAVFGIGFLIAQRIISPLNKLVSTSRAVALGNLEQRVNMVREDEIGTLATSFDQMTENLVDRNRQLVEKASELEAILNSIADGVVVLNPEGEIVTANPAAEQILADMPAREQAHMMATLLAQSGPGSSNFGQALQPDAIKRFQVGNRFYSGLAAPMYTPKGERLGNVVALRDVTREAEIEHLQDGFVTTISHELRTPLTPIKGFSDLLLKASQSGLNESHSPLIEKINTNANRLMLHVNKLIDISQIQAGTLGVQKEGLDFGELVGTVTEQWRGKLEERGLTLNLALPNEAIQIEVDPDRLSWAIDNLLNNACNYTPEGSISVRVCLDSDNVRLDVIDTGVGIATADQPYLFSRFFRANNHHAYTFNVEGVGLGLYITRSIIELHGGQVWVQSKLNKGSTFSLTLPLGIMDN
jgi:signal transduction histidine kinase